MSWQGAPGGSYPQQQMHQPMQQPTHQPVYPQMHYQASPPPMGPGQQMYPQMHPQMHHQASPPPMGPGQQMYPQAHQQQWNPQPPPPPQQQGMPQAGAPQAGVPQAGAPRAGAPQASAPQAGAPQSASRSMVASVPTTIVMKEKVLSLSGDDFSIKRNDGAPILKVKGSVMSISGRKAMFDEGGNHLFDIRKEFLHIHATFTATAQRPDGLEEKLLEVKSKFALLGSKAIITLYPNSPNQRILTMKGNWFDTAANIVDDSSGMVAATISRNLSAKDVFFGQQTYTVTINPGYDIALMAAACICLDEKNNEGKGGLLGLG